MKKYLLKGLFALLPLSIWAQPTLDWQKNIGGSADDFNLISIENFQGDIFISGNTHSSSNGDIPANNGGSDIYVAKLSSSGSIVWSKNFGGSLDDMIVDIAATSDGGIILLCNASSTNGDFTQTGIWLLKLNNAGGTDFKIHYGGNPDIGGGVIQTVDGGYIFNSTKDMAANGLDLWVVKTTSAGAISWEKTFGGTSTEYAADILEYDSHYYVLGESNSSTVNGQSTKGNFDLLFIKINSSGTAQWTKLLGGPGDDGGTGVVLDDSNNFLILGTNSAAGGNVFTNNGGVDLWVINIDATGFSSNNSSIGGPQNDNASGIYFSESTFSGIVTGETFSDWLAGSEPDTSNFLVAELIPFGGISTPPQILGGSLFDVPASIIGTIDGGILVSGHSYSNDGNLNNNKGGADFWIAKLMYPCPDELNLNAATFTKSITRKAENFISTNSRYTGSSTRVKLRSNYLLMEQGFEINAGTVFETEIGGCAD